MPPVSRNSYQQRLAFLQSVLVQISGAERAQP